MRLALLFLLAICLFAQDQPGKWYDFHGQSTTITQIHGPFDSPYAGTNSFHPIRETDTSLTMTLFAVFKHHISLYPTPSAVKAFAKDLSKFKISSSTIQFPLNEPLPLHLIRKIALFRVRESIEKDVKWM